MSIPVKHEKLLPDKLSCDNESWHPQISEFFWGVATIVEALTIKPQPCNNPRIGCGGEFSGEFVIYFTRLHKVSVDFS